MMNVAAFNLKPNYSILELIEYYKTKELNSIDSAICNCIIEVLEDSEKYLFHNYFENYIYDLKDFSYAKDTSFINFEALNKNISLEYFNPYNNQEIVLNVIDFKHPLFKKLINLLGQSHELSKKKAKLLLYFEKHKDEWLIPVETIYVDENGKEESLKIFPSKSFKLKNSIEHKDKLDSFKGFFNGLLDIFKCALYFFNDQQEYVYIPPIYKNKYNKGYYYKVPQMFLKNPRVNINTDEGLSMGIKNKNKVFYKNKNNLKDSLFIK